MSTFKAQGELPKCKRCNAILRPNVLMFGMDALFPPTFYFHLTSFLLGDAEYIECRTQDQEKRFGDWLESVTVPIAVVEIGAGLAVPTVRHVSEQV